MAAFRHGQWNSPEYLAYIAAKNRCNNSNSPKYPDYGGAGIKFRFTNFEEWFAALGKRPSPSHTVDRKDNEKDYCSDNVRWADKHQQAWNRRKARGDSTSEYKGVSWQTRSKTWQAWITYRGKSIYLGSFADEEKAARAYDAKAMELFGAFACPNFSAEAVA